MQLREKPRGGQLSISENVVNVPADVMSTVNKLPRMLTEDETIALKFKRSLNYLGMDTTRLASDAGSDLYFHSQVTISPA